MLAMSPNPMAVGSLRYLPPIKFNQHHAADSYLHQHQVWSKVSEPVPETWRHQWKYSLPPPSPLDDHTLRFSCV